MESPRALALKSLVKMDTSSVFSNLEINTTLTRNKDLDPKDKGLYTALFLGVIENKMLLDYIIKAHSKISLDKIDIEELNILRMGIYQLYLMDKIPEYSAVNESVSLAKKRSKGFINAVLRAFIRNGKKVELPKEKWERVSVLHSLPMEIIKLLIDSYGETTTYELITETKAREHLSLRVNTLRTNRDSVLKLVKEKGNYELSQYSDNIIKCDLSISQAQSILNDGLAFVQDEASYICANVVGARAGERVLDACACPGGKSFSMAMEMENQGYLLSCDLHENKLSLIEKTGNLLGINIITTKAQNGKEYVSELDSSFDRVLCDVPCSGLGIIFKKPDIKYKSLESINNLPCVQLDILKNCSRYVKVGGILVYSTCTINKKENEDNVVAFLKENPCFEPVDFSVQDISSANGMYTFMPHINNTDGFFVAKMKRVK